VSVTSVPAGDSMRPRASFSARNAHKHATIIIIHTKNVPGPYGTTTTTVTLVTDTTDFVVRHKIVQHYPGPMSRSFFYQLLVLSTHNTQLHKPRRELVGLGKFPEVLVSKISHHVDTFNTNKLSMYSTF